MFLIPDLYLPCCNLIHVLILQSKRNKTADYSVPLHRSETRLWTLQLYHPCLVFSYLDLSVLIHFLTRHSLQTSKSSCCLLQTLLILCEAPCLTMTKCFSWGPEILGAVKESLFTPQTRLLFINPGMVFTLCTAGWLYRLLYLSCSVLSPIYTKYLLEPLLPLYLCHSVSVLKSSNLLLFLLSNLLSSETVQKNNYHNNSFLFLPPRSLSPFTAVWWKYAW